MGGEMRDDDITKFSARGQVSSRDAPDITRRAPSIRVFALLAGLALSGAANAGEAIKVDLELILAVDVSGSMDPAEQRLQRDGYVAAFRHPDLIRAIESGPFGRISVLYFEWAGEEHQSVAVPWTVIDDANDARAVADRLDAREILPAASTSIAGGLAFSEQIFAASKTSALRRVIDVSGDGIDSNGPQSIKPVRERLIAGGVTINGLAIEIEPGAPSGWLAGYYRRLVIGGPGAFAIAVDDVSHFADAIRRKLVLEIAGVQPEFSPAFAAMSAAGARHEVRERLDPSRSLRIVFYVDDQGSSFYTAKTRCGR